MLKRHIWSELEAQAHLLSKTTLKTLYKSAPERDIRFKYSACGITLDFSKQKITNEALQLLIDLANSCQLKDKIHALMSGAKVNTSENRAALHTALRVPEYKPFWLDGRDIMLDVFNAREQMEAMAEKIRSQAWLGYTHQAITDVINIGMGGSDLGIKLCLNALYDDESSALRFHFISDADPDTFKRTVLKLNPATTLFIVSSKSFTTQETLFNMKQAMDWIGSRDAFEQHFIAVTAYPKKAHAFGIQQVLPLWEWVGGRYSVCSAVNLMTMIAIGPDKFKAFLAGAHAMDEHFKNTSFDKNLPVLAALLGIWNTNFNNIHTLLMLVYSSRLEPLVPYIQQLDMESNGKHIDRDNQAVPYATGPIVWGGHGNRAQHSYYQWLCQGTHRVAIDFISLKTFDASMLNAFCHAKQRVLTEGIGVDLEGNASKQILGETPLNHFQLEQCSPYILGALISLYEHKIYTQGVIWNINSFDQPGVERAKQPYEVS
jgi:glucose-6-phosphate isomerase